TTTHMVPANFQRILALPDDVRDRYDISSLRLVVHAAAPCPVPLKRAFMEYVGVDKVWEYYGASEGGGTVISPQEWLQKPGRSSRRARSARSGSHRQERASSTTTTRRRPRRSTRASSSRWATPPTST